MANSATLTVTGSSRVPTRIISAGSPDDTLAGFEVTVTDEPVTVGRQTFNVGPNPMYNVRLVDKTGTITLAGPVDSIDEKVTFTDSVTYHTGTRSYMLFGRIGYGATNSPVVISTNPGTDWSNAYGQTSGNNIPLPNQLTTFNRMVVYGYPSGARIENIWTPSDTNQWNVSMSAKEVVGYNYGLQESEDLINWRDCMNVGGTSGTNPENSGELLTTLSVFRTNTHLFFRLTETAPNKLTVSTSALSPTYQVVAGGSVNTTVGSYQFHANIEPIELQRIGLKLTQGSASDLVQVAIWDGAVQVGSAIFAGANTSAICTLPNPIFISKNGTRVLTVKSDFSPIGIPEPVTESGHVVAIDYDDGHPGNTSGFGIISGQNVNAVGATGVAGVRVFKSYPSFWLEELPLAGLTDGRLLRFSARANEMGPVSLAKLTSFIQGTNVTLTNISLYVFTDNNYSQPVAGTIDGLVSDTGGDYSRDSWINTNLSAQGEWINARWSEFYVKPELGKIVIPAGQRFYFEIRANVSITGADSYLITRMETDRWIRQDMQTTYLLWPEASLIWSPNSRGVSDLMADPDWTNEWRVPGFVGLQRLRVN